VTTAPSGIGGSEHKIVLSTHFGILAKEHQSSESSVLTSVHVSPSTPLTTIHVLETSMHCHFQILLSGYMGLWENPEVASHIIVFLLNFYDQILKKSFEGVHGVPLIHSWVVGDIQQQHAVRPLVSISSVPISLILEILQKWNLTYLVRFHLVLANSCLPNYFITSQENNMSHTLTRCFNAFFSFYLSLPLGLESSALTTALCHICIFSFLLSFTLCLT